MWINGPFPCGQYPDIKIFRQDLKFELEDGEMVEADLGYRGEPQYVKNHSQETMCRQEFGHGMKPSTSASSSGIA